MSYQKFTKDIGIIGLVNLLIALRGLILLSVITKLLGPENYGIWAQIIVTLTLMTVIVTLGLPYTLVRFLAAEKDKKEIQNGVWSVLTLIFAVSLIISLFLIFFSTPISGFFGGEKILIQILAFTIIFECLNWVFLNVFRAFQEMGKYSSFMIFQILGEIGLVMAAVLLGYALLGAVLSLLIIRLANFLIMGGFVIKKIGIKIPNFSRIKEYLSFGLPTVPGNLSSWVISSSDRYLIGFFWGTLFVGYYAPAHVFGSVLTFLITPLLLVLPPVLSKFFDENKINEVKIYLKYSLKYFLMVAIPLAFGLSVLSKQILTIFSTSEIAENSYFVVPFIALSILLFGTYAIFFQILSLKKKTKILGTLWVGAAFLNFGLNIILIPWLGIIGAAVATLIAYFFASMLTWHRSFKELKFDIEWIPVLKSVLASIFMCSVIFLVGPTGLFKTVFAIILGALLYGILIFLFRGFDKKEVNFLKEFFRRS